MKSKRPLDFTVSNGRITFNPESPDDRFTLADPNDKALADVVNRARYDVKALTQADLFCLLFAVESYQHFATHPAGTERMVVKLRQLRRAVRAMQAAREVAP